MKLEVGSKIELGGDVYTVVEMPTKSNNGRIRFEVCMQPTPPDLIMPLHSHPEMTETTEMIEGRMEIFTGGRHLLTGPGESYSSLPGVPHIGRNPDKTHSRFYWTLEPEPSVVPHFTKTLSDYFTGCGACTFMGQLALLRIEQYLAEGLTGKDYVTGEPISAKESLKEAGAFIDMAGGLQALCDVVPLLSRGKAFMAGISPEPIRVKLFDLLTTINEHFESS